jgi:hypothetical protein
VPIGFEIKNSLSELLMMAVVRVPMEGIVGLLYIGAAGGGPMCMIQMEDIELPSKYRLCSSSDDHWKGNKSSFSSDRLGQ